MTFVHQALAWGFLIALAPVLIHLINMMRHQRVKWAAMDFLLKSYKKHRKWVWLKQLLLLLARRHFYFGRNNITDISTLVLKKLPSSLGCHE